MRGGRRFLWIAALAATLPGATLGSALDPANTGATSDPGPPSDDVALRVRLDAARAFYSTPYVLDRDAYVLAWDHRWSNGHDESGIWRVGLDDGRVTLLTRLDSTPTSWATDGARFYVGVDEGVVALDRATGAEAWRTPLPPLAPGHFAHLCLKTVVRDERVYVMCASVGGQVPGIWERTQNAIFRLADNGTTFALAVHALDAGSGDLQWTWARDAIPSAAPTPPEGLEDAFAATGWAALTTANGMAVAGEYVLLVGAEVTGSDVGECWIQALREHDGTPAWELASGPRGADPQPSSDGAFCGISGEPTGTATEAFVVLRRLHRLNIATGAVLWSAQLGGEDARRIKTGAGLALGADALYAASAQTVYRFDPADPEHLAAQTIPPENADQFASTTLLVDGSRRVYARAVPLDGGEDERGRIYVFDGSTLAPTWQLDLAHEGDAFDDSQFAMAVASGVLVVAGNDGQVIVVGRTGASLRPAVRVDEEYPAAGEEVEVDLSESLAGAGGAPTRFRADWGDGAVDEWRADPVFRHAYATDGPRTARFFVANEAGQTSSEVVVFRVGEDAPNVVSAAFSPERQELTFFVLGLLLTGAGAAYGLARVRRRHTLLKRELSAVDEVYARSRGRPGECDAALAERRTRAIGLLSAGRLDEAQCGVLERRIDELARRARLGLVDERLRFLPHGMVLDLHEILSDGRVTGLEYRHFVEALERDAHLTPEQKARVRELVDAWHAHDRAL